ncbi:AlbA family DNA-binding domain-containing protein [Arthrobacter sp. 9MFCol3.1]|uniref:AlbA family DNA-binding domain-containing protein n=1 Tax=Arthrobacter sp. 9MFCol3.1 TaxID=1150398 RepID=UPI00047A24DE|nr:ATP-binding protein [Arthrobacter sp. 9MFCol3.1]
MNNNIPAAMAPLMAKAFTTGVETSIAQLAELLGLPEGDPLWAVEAVVRTIEAWGLELNPNQARGSLESARVLRIPEVSTSKAAIAKLLAIGEGSGVEFKSSLLCSIRDWRQDGTLNEHPALPGEVLKTVCAFLNSDGGELLIGIDDDGEPCQGIERDLELKGWDFDKWQLHLVSLIEGRFLNGAMVMPYTRIQLHQLDNAAIAHVTVMRRTARSFVRREKSRPYEFFVRNGSRSDSLDLPSFYAHLQSRSDI